MKKTSLMSDPVRYIFLIAKNTQMKTKDMYISIYTKVLVVYKISFLSISSMTMSKYIFSCYLSYINVFMTLTTRHFIVFD